MRKVHRRGFLLLAGVGSAAAAASAAAPAAQVLGGTTRGATAPTEGRTYTFRAVAGLPAQPLPAYATYVLSGHVDRVRRGGVVTQTVFAGAPAAMSDIALPGLSRIVRVTDVQEQGSALHLTGVVDDRSQLQPGESPHVAIRIDRGRGVVAAGFYGAETQLQLEG